MYILAYAFLNSGSWRLVFWLPLALDAVALILVFFFYHPLNQYIHEEGKSQWKQVREMDFVGCFFFIAGIVLFLLGISFGGNQYPWYVFWMLLSISNNQKTGNPLTRSRLLWLALHSSSPWDSTRLTGRYYTLYFHQSYSEGYAPLPSYRLLRS